jgi:hypothetical protein
MNSDSCAVSLSKAILGLSELANRDEIEARTKDFGELVNTLIKKKTEWELEEKQKEKLR